jgi:RND superfamily putative drug exporter
MDVLTRLVLDHKRLVLGFWVVVTIAALAAIQPAGNALSQQFDLPGREGFETNQALGEIYGNGGDVAPIVPVVTLPRGTTVDSPGITRQLDAALARVETALPEARTASYASTRDRAFVSEDGRTTFALVYVPQLGGVDPGQAEARLAQAALAASPSADPRSRRPASTHFAPPPVRAKDRAPVSCWGPCWRRSRASWSSSSSSVRSWRSCRC